MPELNTIAVFENTNNANEGHTYFTNTYEGLTYIGLVTESFDNASQLSEVLICPSNPDKQNPPAPIRWADNMDFRADRLREPASNELAAYVNELAIRTEALIYQKEQLDRTMSRLAAITVIAEGSQS